MDEQIPVMAVESPERLSVPALAMLGRWVLNLARADRRGAEVRNAAPVVSEKAAKAKKRRCVLVICIFQPPSPLVPLAKLACDPRFSLRGSQEAHHLTPLSTWGREAVGAPASTGPGAHIANRLAVQGSKVVAGGAGEQ